ncbi:heat-shock protein HtpX [Thermogymnomonas acidicola]|uniref:Protease HtpX homolog n=1 Tax=Thermogymnomonas acidicola TaxID=399579 RepID=A0AA37F9K3_9ARCH|nr:zinc metalloprotease HtpX [Thermogymnomonas acidicola]GGM75166.1 heat-shock protein HtpX [Thermogymnomonas acidicola]
MDLISAKLRLGSVALGLAIFLLAAAIVYGIEQYMGYGIGFLALLIFLLPVFIFIDILQWLFGPYIIGMAYRTHKLSPSDPEYQMLDSVVTRVAIYNNMRKPDIYIAEVDMPNAFAYGSPIAGKRVAVTRGLLRILNEKEIEAVLGHEIGHLRHHDVEMLLAIGLIPTLLFYFGYLLLFSGSRERNAGIVLLFAIIAIVLSFLFRFFILAFNRMRESYADANSALTVPGGADNLETGLAKIVAASGTHRLFRRRNRNTSSSVAEMLFISNPDQGEIKDYRQLLEEWKTMKVSRFAAFFSDHPHPAKRIQMLERIKQSQAQ